MITANQAKEALQKALLAMTNELQNKLEGVIQAAIKQGSCKATFYARNSIEREHALLLLGAHGYNCKLVEAKDQRDNDRIEIQWG